MRYLVLGSAGQVGLSLCRYLRDQQHSVIEFDIVDGPRYDLRTANNPLLDRAIKSCDFVFFLAWDVGGSTYLARYQDTYDFISNNVKIMNNVFEVLQKYQKPFIFASSQMANMSYSSYGLTKSLGEKLTEVVGGLTVKFWNVYGIEHDPNKTHVITDFIKKAFRTGVIDMRTDGTESRQMLYANDCSECLYTLSQLYSELPWDRQYHITSFEWVTVMEIAEIIAAHFPGTVIQPAASKDMVQKDKRNEADTWILNYWKPKTTLAQGIQEIIEHMKGKNYGD